MCKNLGPNDEDLNFELDPQEDSDCNDFSYFGYDNEADLDELDVLDDFDIDLSDFVDEDEEEFVDPDAVDINENFDDEDYDNDDEDDEE